MRSLGLAHKRRYDLSLFRMRLIEEDTYLQLPPPTATSSKERAAAMDLDDALGYDDEDEDEDDDEEPLQV